MSEPLLDADFTLLDLSLLVIRLGDKAVGWRIDEIEQWVNARPNSIDLLPRGK